MRSCLAFLVLVVLLVGALAWFVLPVVAGPVLVASLAASGLAGRDTQVTVNADPPLELLLLRARRVHVSSSDVHARDLSIGGLDLSMTDLSLLDRTFATIAGTLTDVGGHTTNGLAFTIPNVAVSGTDADTKVSFTLPTGVVQTLATDAASTALGSSPTSVRLVSPALVELAARGGTVEGTLAIDGGGSLVVRFKDPRLGSASFVIVASSSVRPLVLEHVRVVAAGLQVDGRLDASGLGL